MAADTLNMPSIAATTSLGTPTLRPRPNGTGSLTILTANEAATAPVVTANKKSTFTVG